MVSILTILVEENSMVLLCSSKQQSIRNFAGIRQ
jgi:hypothetical protein